MHSVRQRGARNYKHWISVRLCQQNEEDECGGEERIQHDEQQEVLIAALDAERKNGSRFGGWRSPVGWRGEARRRFDIRGLRPERLAFLGEAFALIL